MKFERRKCPRCGKLAALTKLGDVRSHRCPHRAMCFRGNSPCPECIDLPTRTAIAEGTCRVAVYRLPKGVALEALARVRADVEGWP